MGREVSQSHNKRIGLFSSSSRRHRSPWFRSAVGRNPPSVAANPCSNPSNLTKRRQPVGRTTAYVIAAPKVLDSNEADRLGDHDRLPRRPDADAGSGSNNLEAESADAALV